MLGFAETALSEVVAHTAFVCGYGLLLAEVVRGSRGTRALRKAAIAVGAIVLALAHGYIAWQLFNSHPYSAVLKRHVADQVEVARKAGGDLVAELSRRLGTPRQ